MNSELRELYQEVILDHNRHPRNFRKIEDPSMTAEGYNPLCGDEVTVYLDTADGVVRDITFQGRGCAISTASASMMTERLKGRTLAEVEALFQAFHALVLGTSPDELETGHPGPELGKLAVFSSVCDHPTRVKCASLAWHTVRAAIRGESQPVSTE